MAAEQALPLEHQTTGLDKIPDCLLGPPATCALQHDCEELNFGPDVGCDYGLAVLARGQCSLLLSGSVAVIGPSTEHLFASTWAQRGL